MTRSSVALALVCLVALLARPSSGFTISLAPLLTTRLGLGPWGSAYVQNFPDAPVASSRPAPAVESSAVVHAKAAAAAKAQPAARTFKFEYDDIRMISGCKSECLELIYAKSMDRGFASA